MANFNYNEIHLGGRVTEKPQLQTTASGKAVCRFNICVNKKIGDRSRADFFTVQVWESRAEFVTKFFDKGSSIYVVGELVNTQWTDQQGVKRYGVQVNAKEVCFVDKKMEMPADGSGAGDVGTTYPPQSDMPELANEEELPF
jgi:single-strand DNA-binding protein